MVYTIGKNVVAYEAREQDLDDLLALIYEIAVYEKMEKEVTATKETLKQSRLVDCSRRTSNRLHAIFLQLFDVYGQCEFVFGGFIYQTSLSSSGNRSKNV